MQGRLAGKAIIVAGAGGIGAGLARRYASEGASVLIGDIEGAAAEAAANEITDAGGTAVATWLDGADEASVQAVVAQAVSLFGGLDGFHCNFACFRGGDEDLLNLAMEDFDEVMRVNTRGFVLCTRAALPPIIARGGGAILYTSSGAAYMGQPGRVAYAMSKVALHALMRNVASRYGRDGVRANALTPGMVTHPKFEALVPADCAQAMVEVTPMHRLGRPADVAAMAALLMSDEGNFVSGQVISVDGGKTMRQ
jgi:NAD(P)-dependent dehydrogenase (short-subunit alcohol dehydrogenase family)